MLIECSGVVRKCGLKADWLIRCVLKAKIHMGG